MVSCFLQYVTMYDVYEFNLVEMRIPKNFLSVVHPSLVSGPVGGVLEVLNLTTRCIPMDVLAWTDCVGSGAGGVLYIDMFSGSNLQKY